MAAYKDYIKEKKEEFKQKRKLLPFKDFNLLRTPSYKALQEKRFKRLLARVNENSNEKKLYEDYLKIVKASFKADNKHQKFSLNHVEQLGISHDILFLYSKKDVGKTWAAADHIRKLLDSDPEAQIVFIRNSREEAKGFIEMMNNSDHWPTWTNGDLIFKKEDIKEGKRKGKGSNKNPEPCGIFGYATKGARGFERWQGGNWDRVKFWYWDECNSIEGGLNHDVFLRLNVFLSSMIRDKKNVKGLMTGNLLEKSNIFLERLGVGSRTRLKIFKVHKDNDPRQEVLSTMLYINTGDLFKGIESQSGLASQFLTEKEMTSLLSNRPGELAGKAIYEEVDLKNLKPLFAFVFTAPGSPTLANLDPEELIYIMYSYRVPESSRMVVWIDRFEQSMVKAGFNAIYCHDSYICNKYNVVIPIEEKEEFGEAFIEPIKQVLYVGEVWFGWNGTEQIFEKYWPRLETKYIKEDTNAI